MGLRGAFFIPAATAVAAATAQSKCGTREHRTREGDLNKHFALIIMFGVNGDTMDDI